MNPQQHYLKTSNTPLNELQLTQRRGTPCHPTGQETIAFAKGHVDFDFDFDIDCQYELIELQVKDIMTNLIIPNS